MPFRGPEGSTVASDRSSDGFALIVVLWSLVLIAAIGAYMVANARSQTALAHNVLAAARAEGIADAAVAQAVFNLNDPDIKKRWRLDDTPYVINLPGGQATVRLEDERAKINPNFASDRLLAAFFQSIGIDNGRAGRLGACIADWVSKGDQARPLGAKMPEYQAAGRKYGPPGAPVEDIDELQLVLGMTPETLVAARPYLTIFTSDATPPHLAMAAPPVVRAVQAVSHDPATQSAGVTQGNLGAPPAESPADQPPGGQQPGTSGAAAPADPAIMIVTIDATGRSFDGGTYVRRAVVKLDFDNPKGYAVLDWRRGTIAN